MLEREHGWYWAVGHPGQNKVKTYFLDQVNFGKKGIAEWINSLVLHFIHFFFCFYEQLEFHLKSISTECQINLILTGFEKKFFC